MEMSKSEFAAHIGVVPSRITAMIASGIIGPDAIVGEGRKARIRVELATDQVRSRRHIGQSLSNGLSTRLASPAAPADEAGGDGDVSKQIQLERLEYERRRNRQAAIAERQAAGQLVLVEDFRREIGTVAAEIMGFFESIPVDLGNELAAKFGLPSRDVIHATRAVINAKRNMAAERLRKRAADLADTVEVRL